jgi:Acyl-CoA reductase (LuxC)
MNSESAIARPENALCVPHIVMGAIMGDCTQPQSTSDSGAAFWTPKLDLDGLVLPRGELPPAYNLPTGEVIDFLVATGERLDFETNPWLAEAVESTARVNPLPRFVVENIYRELPMYFRRETLEFEIERTLGSQQVLDGWQSVTDWSGRDVSVRAFPSRLVQILAGNSPSVAATSIVRGAMSKSVSILKLPSNDLFTCSAILRTMADIDADHPVLRSFSAVYWCGGDAAIENILYRPQYVDKIIVWGGESAVKNVVKYLRPGIEMVAFDPKVSVSMIGQEAHADEEKLRQVAELAATDVQLLNQEACAASRYQFVEGSAEQVDHYCEVLAEQLNVDRVYGSAKAVPPPQELRIEVEALREFDPDFKAWGRDDGSGMVVRSPKPVSFHPIGKVVNVIPVKNIADGIDFASPATQTVGVWPPDRKTEVRDRLCAAGVQRTVALGMAGSLLPGLPHDGFLPLQRFVKWVADEG